MDRDDPGSALSPGQKGAVAETAIAARATRLGIEVYRPVAEGGRFDMIFVAPPTPMLRVQCKWAARRGGVIVVPCQSCRRTASGFERRPYVAEEIDAIAAYCEQGDRCFLLPVAVVASRPSISLRVAPARNNQSLRVNWASDYELDESWLGRRALHA